MKDTVLDIPILWGQRTGSMRGQARGTVETTSILVEVGNTSNWLVDFIKTYKWKGTLGAWGGEGGGGTWEKIPNSLIIVALLNV